MKYFYSFIPMHLSNQTVLFFMGLLDIMNQFVTLLFKSHIKKNKVKNQKALNSNHAKAKHLLIENQNSYTDVAFGHTTIAYSGCEVIALYNALKDLKIDEEISFVDLIEEIEYQGKILGGFFGTNPKAIKRYCEKNQIACQFETNIDLFDELIDESKGFILTVYNNMSDIRFAIHSFYVSISEKGYVCHNLYGNSKIYHYPTYELLMNSINNGHSKAICLLGILKD